MKTLKCKECWHKVTNHDRYGCKMRRSTGGGQVHPCPCNLTLGQLLELNDGQRLEVRVK